MKHYIFMGALAACMLGSCGGHEGHDHEAEGEAKEAHAAHADEIVLTPEKSSGRRCTSRGSTTSCFS